MTPAEAIAHAEKVIKSHQMANASYIANGQLAAHALTAEILIDIATQLQHLQEPELPLEDV